VDVIQVRYLTCIGILYRMFESFEQLYNTIISEQQNNVEKIGVFPGAFKPPHMGHYATALNACKSNDRVYIFVSNKSRALTTQHIAKQKGAKDCDADRYSNFMKNDKYTSNLLSISPAACARMTSASAMRAAISIKDKNTIFKNLPDGVDKDYIFGLLMMSNDQNNPEYGHISIEQTMQIWSQYKQLLLKHSGRSDQDIVLQISQISPVKDTYDLVHEINNSEGARNTSVNLYVGT